MMTWVDGIQTLAPRLAIRRSTVQATGPAASKRFRNDISVLSSVSVVKLGRYDKLKPKWFEIYHQ